MISSENMVAKIAIKRIWLLLKQRKAANTKFAAF